MLINRTGFNVALAASDDPQNWTLTGIVVQTDGSMLATDGHIGVHFIPGPPAEEDSYPILDLIEAQDAGYLQPFLMPRKEALIIAKPPKIKGNDTLLRYVMLDVHNTNVSHRVVIGETDGRTETCRHIEKLDTKLPDIRAGMQFISEPRAEITLGMGSFVKLVDTLAALSMETVTLKIHPGFDQALEVVAKDSATGAETLAVIMPVVTPEQRKAAREAESAFERACRDLAPKAGSGCDSVTITNSRTGDSVTLTPEDRERTSQKSGEVADVLAGAPVA
jgi:hypothetical protein